MFELKSISTEAIPSAIEKAKQYRLLGEPFSAESICRDILAADPGNAKAGELLVLALTDKFRHSINPAFAEAGKAVAALSDEYCRAYYSGIVCERRAKAHLASRDPGSGSLAHHWLEKAMAHYEKALTSCSPGNEDAVLRWNTCVRIMREHPEVTPGVENEHEHMLE